MKNQLQPINFFVPYYLVIAQVVAASLAHAAAQMTKAKFVLQTMMLRNLAHQASPPQKKKVVVRCWFHSYETNELIRTPSLQFNKEKMILEQSSLR